MSLSEILVKIKEIISFPIFTLNQTPITLTSIFLFIVIIILFAIFSRLLRKKILKTIFQKLKIDIGIQFTLLRITQYIIVSIGIIVAFQFVGIDLSGLAVILGFLSVGIGFGLQNITSNFIAGLILLFERPIKVGDRVTVADKEGDVLNINIRSTTIRSLTNISIIVPNSEFISSSVINWSHGDPKIRIDLDVGVSYNSDIDVVLKALMEVASENKETLTIPKPEVHFVNFGDSSWNMRMRVWINDPKRFYYVRSDLNIAIVKKFKQLGVEIPFPQRDVHFRSPLPIPVESKE